MRGKWLLLELSEEGLKSGKQSKTLFTAVRFTLIYGGPAKARMTGVPVVRRTAPHQTCSRVGQPWAEDLGSQWGGGGSQHQDTRSLSVGLEADSVASNPDSSLPSYDTWDYLVGHWKTQLLRL